MIRKQVLLSIAALLIIAACAAPSAAPTPIARPIPAALASATAAKAEPTVPVRATAVPADPTAGVKSSESSATAGAPAATASAPDPVASTGKLVLKLLSDGSKASYRVREQLAGRSLPNDGVGTTTSFSGSITFRPDGTIVPDQSAFTIDMRTLKSDESRRDGFIQRSTLQTGKFPTATFVPTAVDGLPSPLPTSGDVNFKLSGDLTVRGVTKPVTWDVQAAIAGRELTGAATTAFKFGDFGMNPPKVPIVLGVVDNITLEVKFHLSL